jgi:hypothetical protein
MQKARRGLPAGLGYSFGECAFILSRRLHCNASLDVKCIGWTTCAGAKI